MHTGWYVMLIASAARHYQYDALSGIISFAYTLEPLNSGPLNSGKPLINRQARLDQWIFHYIKTPH